MNLSIHFTLYADDFLVYLVSTYDTAIKAIIKSTELNN